MPVAFVTEAHNDTSGAQAALTVSLAITAGQTVVVVVAGDRDPNTVTGIVDNGSGSSAYVAQVTVPGVGSVSCGFEIWTCLAAGSGVTTVTITMSGAQRFCASVVACSGVTTIGTHASTAATGTTAQSPGTLGSETFVVGGFAQGGLGSAGSAVVGTVLANDYISNQGNTIITSMYNAGTSISFTFPGSVAWVGGLVGLSAGGGGSTVTYPELERGTNRGSNRGRNTGIARSFVRRDRIFVPAYAVVGELREAA